VVPALNQIEVHLLILHQVLPSEFDATLEAYRALKTLLAEGPLPARQTRRPEFHPAGSGTHRTRGRAWRRCCSAPPGRRLPGHRCPPEL